MAKDVYIQVVVTSTRRFRAKISPKPNATVIPFEVTVNGQQWHEGKGVEYREEILSKCRDMITKLTHEVEEA